MEIKLQNQGQTQPVPSKNMGNRCQDKMWQAGNQEDTPQLTPMGLG